MKAKNSDECRAGGSKPFGAHEKDILGRPQTFTWKNP
jgi:hypothetical protein